MMTSRSQHLSLSLSVCAFGISFLTTITAAQAQIACQPTVYLIRHAEDTPTGPPSLTIVGQAHAGLYPNMLGYFATTYGFCPIQRVFAMYNVNPDGSPGTSNPEQTAVPLARAIHSGYSPEMYFDKAVVNPTTRYYFYEHIESKSSNGNQNALAGTMLRDYLNSYFQTEQGGASVAIFYTRQGMPDVSTALNVVLNETPVNNPDPLVSWPGELRSSVNVIYWNKSPFEFQKQYSDAPYTAIRVKSIQCFNVNPDTKQYDDNKYYCQYSGNLDDYNFVGDLKEVNKLKGKICGALSPPRIIGRAWDGVPPDPISPSTIKGIFGYC